MSIKLKELITLKYGKRQIDVEDENGTIPIYGTGGVFGKANVSLYSKPSILLGRKGTIDKPFWVDHPFWCVDTMFYSIIDDTKVVPRYLFYNLLNIDFSKYNEGTTIPSLRIETLNNIDISLHSNDEQHYIVDILGTLDEKIENNTSIINKISSLIELEYSKHFRDCDFTEEPLSNVFSFQEGPGIRNWQYVDDGIRFINIRCINNGDIDVSTMNKISENEAFGIYKHFLLKEWDLVISMSGTLGRYAIVRKEHLPLCLNTSVIRFYPKISFSYYSFMYAYLTSKDFILSLGTLANGSAQQNVGPTHLKKIVIKMPPITDLESFHKKVFPLIEQMLCLRKDNQKINELKQLYLQKFFG